MPPTVCVALTSRPVALIVPRTDALTVGEALARANDMPALRPAPTAMPKVSARAEGLALALTVTAP